MTKGAPEIVLALTLLPDARPCRRGPRALPSSPRAAHKVIACACATLVERLARRRARPGVSLRGSVAFEDPVREGVAEAVRRCREAGIHVVMVTGDHP